MSKDLNRLTSGFLIVIAAIVFAGTEACQKSYEFADQASIAPSTAESESPSPSSSSSGSDSPSETPSDGASDSPSESVSASIDDEEIIDEELTADRLDAFSSSLASYEKMRKSNPGKSTTENWLGKSYKDQEVVAGVAEDSDGDGYTDALEKDFGSDPFDSGSFPAGHRTRLADRLAGFDDDGDGLPNEEEIRRGTDPNEADSDKDGFSDGAEVLSKTDPRDPKSKPIDRDGDGLSDEFESNYGTNPNSADTDGDGLRDDIELAIGSDPFSNDTDSDGILDGREVSLGSDPTIPEWK